MSALADGVPRSTNVEHYARIVKEKSTLRNLIYSANKIVTTAYAAEEDADTVLDRAEQEIFSIVSRLSNGCRKHSGQFTPPSVAISSSAITPGISISIPSAVKWKTVAGTTSRAVW